ncbi:unnamed protein product [Lymnaea stagnalis]|uniref:Uncharacterized protein n=1 Tax=Lymnaea stagnalis TaxID=6523 RepID=A0AAV2IA44_LYMST
MTSPVRPLDPELLSFLQTLVNGGDEPQPEKTDSDKENEAGRIGENMDAVESERNVRFSDSLDGSGNGNENIQTDDSREHQDGLKDKNNDSVTEEDYKYETFEGDNHEGQKQQETVNMSDGSAPKTKNLKKKKKKTLKKFAQRPMSAHPTVTMGSQTESNHHTEGYEPNKQETMSETGGRRLGRRKQVSRPRCAGPEPKGDVLQQKYLELRQLIVTPLVHSGQSQKLSREQLLRLQAASQQYAAGDSLPQAGNGETTGARKHVYIDLNQNNLDDGYGTIRTVQILTHAKNAPRPQTAGHKQRPLSGHSIDRRALSASQTENNLKSGDRGRVRDRNERNAKLGRSDSGSGRTSQAIEKHHSSEHHSSDDKNRSGSQSPRRVILPSDTHLKNTNNPLLKQWLKKKEKELRRRKRDERKKAKEEREKKQELEQEKQESLKESDQKVREWMVKKRKEAFLREKEARKMIKEEERKMLERQQRQQLTPVSRPLTPGDETTRSVKTVDNFIIHNGESITPSPPPSKFVYKRPVSGRVKLIKFQQVRKEDAKRAEQEKEKFQKKLAEEKARKMRVSYDQWLLKKREDDYTKRQEAARQRALAKSDPELERIVPQLARNRIDNIQRGKKRVITGVTKFDEDINKSFGGGDFDQEAENVQVQGRYQFGVLGSKSNLTARPSSAKIQVAAPQMSKSPRRPASAHPAVDSRIQNCDSSDTNPFKLPFPPEQGAPKHVLDKQRKLFAPQVMLTMPNGQQVSNIELQSDQQTPQLGVEEDKDDTTPKLDKLPSAVDETAAPLSTSEHPDQKSIDEDNNNRTDSEQTFLSYFVTANDIDQAKDNHQGIKSPRQHSVEEVAEELPEDFREYDSSDHSSESSSLTESPRTDNDKMEQDANEELTPMQGKKEHFRDTSHDAAVNPNDLYENLSLNLGYSEEDEEPDKSQVYYDTPEKSDDMVEDKAASELSESKNFGKHVSFQENPVVFEPPDLEDGPDVGPDGVVDEESSLFEAQLPNDDDDDNF